MPTTVATPRVPPLPLDEFRSVERELGREPSDPPLNVFRTLAHNPALFVMLAGVLNSAGTPPEPGKPALGEPPD